MLSVCAALTRPRGSPTDATMDMSLSPEEWSVIGLSLKVSLVAVAAMLPVAFALAWILARWRFPGKLLLDALVYLPLVVPPVVTGWLLLILFGANGPIGGWLDRWLGITLLFRWTGAALAAAIMAMPLMVRAMRLSIEAIDCKLEQAAATWALREHASSCPFRCRFRCRASLPG